MSAEEPATNATELSEEEKFKRKFPNKKPMTTDVMRKRLQKGVKYFDSGDYMMAKSRDKNPRGPVNPAVLAVGKGIPTPDKIPHRKTSVPMTEHPVTQTVPTHPHQPHHTNVEVEN
ncbi:predicted protein [Nematostella vectensis]|uniref:cAMP-regulated phosphoprotein 19 n=1 Tax=Nematostella vectensis TaxID=45351 RepID=A7SV53_NEMVE|nr:alpha-endosulfine [Nematostella vectensis]EDO32409.1 predicted protein [Nematostella vectensis]|eukprot:XP_001624509.1 predicted protein [Nematostella vectensis]